MSIISLYSVGDIANLAFSSDPNYMSSFVQNGIFWENNCLFLSNGWKYIAYRFCKRIGIDENGTYTYWMVF